MSSNTNIGNTPVNQGYVQLIHTGETGGIDGTLRTLYDGDGTASDLQIASNKVKVSTELYIGSKTATEFIQDIVGDMFTTGSYTNITTTYDDTNGNIDLNATGAVSGITGGTGIDATGSGNITIAIDSTVATLTGTQTLTNKTLASPTFSGDIDFTDASTPTFTITDTTNSVTASFVAADSSSVIGTTSSHNFGIKAHNARKMIFESTAAIVNDISADYDFRIKDSSGANLFSTDAANSRVGILDSTPSYTLDVNGTGRFTGAVQLDDNLTVTGDLQVNGTTTTVNQTNLDVSDNIIGLNRGASSNANDSGLIIERGSTGDNVFIGWDESADRVVFGVTSATPDSTGNLTIVNQPIQAARLYGDVSGNVTGSASLNLLISSNLSDLANVATARTNLGLGTLATLSSVDFDRIDGSAYIASNESFSDSDLHLMTAAAIDDLIISKGYGFGDGDMTGVSITASNPLDISQSNTTSGNYTATISLDATEFQGYLTDMQDLNVGADELLVIDIADSTLKRKAISEIRLSLFDDTGFSSGISFNGSTANGLLTYGNSTTADVESNLTFDGTNLDLPDSKKIRLGTSQDLEIYHDGSNNYIDSTTSNQDLYIRVNDGGVTTTALRIDASDAGTLLPNNNIRMGDSKKIRLGASNDFNLYHDGSNSYIYNETGGGKIIIQNTTSDGDIEIKVSDGGSTTNAIIIDASDNSRVKLPNDNQRLSIGASNDIQITHDGTNSYIDNYTGNLNIKNNEADKDLILLCDDGSGGETAYITLDGSATSVNIAQDVKLTATKRLYLDGGGDSFIFEESANNVMFKVGNNNNLRFNSTGAIFNDAGASLDFRVEGDTDPNLLFVDGSADRVGIGVASPNSLLHIADGVLSIGTGHDLEISHNGTHNFIDLDNGNLYFRDDANNNILIIYREGNGVQLTEGDITIPGTSKLRLDGSTGGDTYITEVAANTIGFNTAGSERMRISSAGRVLIGGTSASGHNFDFEILDNHAYVKGPNGWDGAGDLAIVALGSSHVNEVFGCGYKYGTGLILSTYKVGGYGSFGSSCQDSLTIADTTGAASFINDVIAYASSDKRLKENIKPLDNALDKINKINGVEFDWIDGKDEHGNSVHSNEGHDVGVIAQEIEEVLPEVVHTRDNGYKAVKYEKIVPLLIQAIKEQQQQIEELKNG